jgi:hypothetical protein
MAGLKEVESVRLRLGPASTSAVGLTTGRVRGAALALELELLL